MLAGCNKLVLDFFYDALILEELQFFLHLFSDVEMDTMMWLDDRFDSVINV